MQATNHGRAGKFSRRLFSLLLLGATLSCTGCNVVLLLGYLISGPPQIEPDFDKVTKKSLSKRNTTVVVYCYAPNELKYDQDKVDYEVAKCVAIRLNNQEIKVADPDRVYDWIDKHPDFERDVELGAAFNANYVVKIELRDYSLFAERSHDLYQGRCDGIISVWEMDKKSDGTLKKTGKLIYSKDLLSRYPKEAPLPFNSYTTETFKKLFLAALSDEIGAKFYPTYAGDDYTRSIVQ